MPDNILKIKNKNLREEFLNHPIYSDKNDLDFYKENEENYDNKPYFVLSGPSIAAGAPSMYGYQELEYPRIGFYTLMPGKNPNPKHKYLEQYYGKPTLYRWTKGEGFLNSKHYPEVTSPGDDNYPRIVNEFVTLSNMAGVPTFVGLSPEISKQLNELVVTPKYKYFIIKNKNGGAMKKLIPKHQFGSNIKITPPESLDETKNKIIKTLLKNYFKLGVKRYLQRIGALPLDPQTNVYIRNDVKLTGIPYSGVNEGGKRYTLSEGIDTYGNKGILWSSPDRIGNTNYGEIWYPEGGILYDSYLKDYLQLKNK